ncbi:hypothetical protein FD754_003864 [Muntiacus muntjak]|uniref:Uncharacterized protein n=1 Tax=Muntiacus muntjak TaxID=9888 RepID=A0A5N3WFY2_MUNMU|nr:hypothetical protein FD754_003864 [Muntiacus muntjak]
MLQKKKNSGSFDSHEYLTLNVGSQQERGRGTLTCSSEVKDKASQGREFKEKKPQGMQQSDLFKAEYVFIVDSEGEEEAPGRKGDQGPPVGTGPPAARPASLAISSSLTSDVVRPKTRGVDLQAPLHPERPQAMAPQQRHGQPRKIKSDTVSTVLPSISLELPKVAGRTYFNVSIFNLSFSSTTVYLVLSCFSIREALIKCISGLPGETESMYCVIYEVIPKNMYLIRVRLFAIQCMPGLPVHHQLPEFTQTHVHPVGDAIQPSHPLSSPSPPAHNPSQHQGLHITVYKIDSQWEFVSQ